MSAAFLKKFSNIMVDLGTGQNGGRHSWWIEFALVVVNHETSLMSIGSQRTAQIWLLFYSFLCNTAACILEVLNVSEISKLSTAYKHFPRWIIKNGFEQRTSAIFVVVLVMAIEILAVSL